MSLDMMGFIDPTFESTPEGGVTLVVQGAGGYTGDGGTWVKGPVTRSDLYGVNIQPVSPKEAEVLSEGGTRSATDMRSVIINDGTMLEPDDDGTFAQMLEFSDGLKVRKWRVVQADNRPWRNYCRAVVERYRGER